MSPFRFIHNIFLKANAQSRGAIILPLNDQIKAWRRANRMMGWGIDNNEFEKLAAALPPHLTDDDRMNGFVGSVLFYGFGDDGRGNADAVLSGKRAWDYALQRRKTWEWEYVNFNKPKDIRLRPEAPARPQGFYYAKIRADERSKAMTVSQFRKTLTTDTGWGPEGFQFLAITISSCL